MTSVTIVLIALAKLSKTAKVAQRLALATLSLDCEISAKGFCPDGFVHLVSETPAPALPWQIDRHRHKTKLNRGLARNSQKGVVRSEDLLIANITLG